MFEEKICAFNVSESHLVTMITPYIYEAVNEGKSIVTFFEKDLERIYEKIVKINQKFFDGKSNLKNVNWKETEIKNLPDKIGSNADIAIVAGKKDYINQVDEFLLSLNEKFILVNCFEVDDFNSDLENIVKKHDKILCTEGVREIKELYLV